MTRRAISASGASTRSADKLPLSQEPSVFVPDAQQLSYMPSVPQVPGEPRKFPVVEIFGPTVQGEGPQTGVQCEFVRFGYCDYQHCSWCDSLHAVIPSLVRGSARWLTAAEILGELTKLRNKTFSKLRWVVFSGGNPALQQLDPLVTILHDAGWKIAVETQGSYWRPWLAQVDQVVISPKPPSSGMLPNWLTLQSILAELQRAQIHGRSVQVALKVVVFDFADFEFARQVHLAFDTWPFYVSVGNADTKLHDPQSAEDTAHRIGLLSALEKITEWALEDPEMSDTIVGPQLHVLMKGNVRGV